MAGITIEARKRSTCPECRETIKVGSPISKMFTDDKDTHGFWCHSYCLVQKLDARSSSSIEYVATIVEHVKCPRCSAAVGDVCRDRGSEIPWVHIQRKNAHENAVRANEWRQARAR